MSYNTSSAGKARMRKYDATDKGRARARRHKLKKNFGLSEEGYASLLYDQNFRCAICEVDACPTGRKFAVDHDHLTEQVRGLLCSVCNTALGKMRDDPALLRRAALYLESHQSENTANGQQGKGP